MKLDNFALDLLRRFPLGFVATVTEDGRPAVSPKGTFIALDQETIAFGDIRSPGTLANLIARPDVEVNFIDPFLRKGIRVRGRAQVVLHGSAEFDVLLPRWQEIWSALAPRIKHIVRIPVEQLKLVTTPPYDDGVTEKEMVALYKQKFAELYP